MTTLTRYRREAEETRTRMRDMALTAIRRQREHLARLYAAEAVLALHRHLPQVARLTFAVDDSELDPARASVDLVAVFDATGTLLFPDQGDDVDELDNATLICDMLAAAVEQGGGDFFAAPGPAPSPMLVGATHALTIADLDNAADDDDQAVLAALNLRTYPAEPQHGDRSAHVVLEVLGVTIGVRHRAGETYVHLDTDELPEEFRPLVVEVDNSGENVYGTG